MAFPNVVLLSDTDGAVPPKDVYKFCKSEDLHFYFDRQELRIGSLQSYWGDEATTVNDCNEGIIETEVAHLSWANRSPSTEELEKAKIVGIEFPNPSAPRTVIVEGYKHQFCLHDMPIWCAAAGYSLEAQRQWLTDQAQYDTCIKIQDFHELIPDILTALQEKLSPEEIKPQQAVLRRAEYVKEVAYIDNKINVPDWHKNQMLYPFLKPPRFKWQDEIRLVFGGTRVEHKLSPQNIYVPNLARHCSVVGGSSMTS